MRGSTWTVLGVQFEPDCEQRFPARAAALGTVLRLVVASDW